MLALGRHVGLRASRPARILCRQYSQTSNDVRVGRIPALDLPALDAKWRARWLAEDSARDAKDGSATVGKRAERQQEKAGKMYILPQFPYPSGDLHLGHLRVYTIADVLARFRRMRGHDVLHPIGWDAFGLPAENAAIERGVDPAVWTKQNIQKMKGQLQMMNGSWDWDREFATCDPEYYKHTQTLFLWLHEAGLAYQAESMVNYDPVDKTVLANEQVDGNGCSWRSGAKVEKRMLKQWFFKISEYRDALLKDLEFLAQDGRWPEKVLAMQKNWLGKSEGARIKFPVTQNAHDIDARIEVFTTRPDTIFGVQYLALASTHPIVKQLAKIDIDLQAYLDTMSALPADSKSGYLLPQLQALNPMASEVGVSEAAQVPLPIYVAPYVLGDYGDGAVMGVPGHDTRDHGFWKQNRADEPIRSVIAPLEDASSWPEDTPYVHHGRLTSHNGMFEGQTTAQATAEIVKILQNKDSGSAAETWRLRDWLISRQRYWGTPIPIIHCGTCGSVPVPESELPVELPTVEGHWLRGKAGNPLDDAHDWVNVPCPKCGEPAKRDTDTMDTFVDSSWYFFRYPEPTLTSLPFSPEHVDEAMPVDVYIGGVEHAILHLLYARFISKFLSTTPYWKKGSDRQVRGEPFKQLLTQGMVHGKTYTDPQNGRFLKPSEVDLSAPSRPVVISTGEVANISYEKMSKSKYNGVDPTVCIAKYGADATRAHMLFQAPVSDVLEWDEEKIAGITRWLRRVSQLTHSPALPETLHSALSVKDYLQDRIPDGHDSTEKPPRRTSEAEKKLWRAVQQTINSITEAYAETYTLNTVVSDLMALTNLIVDLDLQLRAHKQSSPILRMALETLLQMMAPITPAFAEECWAQLHQGSTYSVLKTAFPETDGSLEFLVEKMRTCAVQVNGKLRFAVDIPVPGQELQGQELREWVVKEVSKTTEGRKRLEGLEVGQAKKVVVVRGGKLVNFVI